LQIISGTSSPHIIGCLNRISKRASLHIFSGGGISVGCLANGFEFCYDPGMTVGYGTGFDKEAVKRDFAIIEGAE